MGGIRKNKDRSQPHKPLVSSTNAFPVVGIGASAGGLDAFKKLLKAIPEKSGIAYVLVQHLNPDHESLLPELLQKVTPIPVLEISDEVKVAPDHIYIIPSNKIMVANDGVLKLSPRPKKNIPDRSLPIDLFFASLAEAYQSLAIGVVLSGTATDGTQGLKAIKELGGVTFAQDEASAAFGGMPHSAMEAGVVDFILPPEGIPKKLLEVVQTMNGFVQNESTANPDESVFKQILSLLRIRKGTDFTYYKQTTIRRRIYRRMALSQLRELTAYLKFLRENNTEQDVLYQDLLIPVTSFFRDTKTFDNLCQSIFPALIKNKQPNEPIRIWIAGCSTGEEAYSTAICFKELLGDRREKVQIFATDISLPAIEKARTGIYSKNEVDSLTQQRLKEFFVKREGGYQVTKEMRELCVFAPHDFLKDPPFGNIDLISCRNVLIYMEPYLQKKALTTFHYALNPKGFLSLGKSETANHAPDLFSPAGMQDKLFTRNDVKRKYIYTASRGSEQILREKDNHTKGGSIRTDFQKTADDIMLSMYTPAGIVVNEAMDIVHFRGSTGAYLEQFPGKPSHNLFRMAKMGLAFELRNILHKVKKVKVPVVKENIPFQINETEHLISIEAIPLPDIIEPHYLILFYEGPANSPQISQRSATKKTVKSKKSSTDQRIEQLEKELLQAREDMRGITEDQEAANEELQSANEELLSGSEELQSLNEELETSKEELQSINEELIVVNQELISLNEQVTRARDYAEAIVSTVREPLLILDRNLRVKSANLSFYKKFQVHEKETEGKLVYELGDRQWDIPALRKLLETILPEKESIFDFEMNFHFPSIGERSMLLNAREITVAKGEEKLILLSIEDITEYKKVEEVLHYRTSILEAHHHANLDGILLVDAKGKILSYNHRFIEIWNMPKQIAEAKDDDAALAFAITQLVHPAQFIEKVKSLYEHPSETSVDELEFKDGKIIQRHGYPVIGENGIYYAWSWTFRDITQQKNDENRIKESEANFRQLTELMPDKISTSDPEGNINYYNQNWLIDTGYSSQELKDWGWEKIIHPDDLEKLTSGWKHSLATGDDFEMEFRLLHKNGEYNWHLCRSAPLKNESGKIVKWIAATTEIQKAKVEQQRKDDFLKMVSHELKTPVTSIKGYVQLLLLILEEHNKTSFPVQVKSSLVRIDQLVLRLTRLITEMLDLTRIEAGKLELQNDVFSINDVVDETTQDIRYTHPKHLITIDHDFYGTVTGDKDRIEQVIINLLNNAIKYSADNNKIEIRVQKADNNQVAVSIQDYGIGIDEKEHQKIFERFYRVTGKLEQTYAGFGIGLFIAKAIIERHHGFIHIQSEKGKGSIFTFTLPLTIDDKASA